MALHGSAGLPRSKPQVQLPSKSDERHATFHTWSRRSAPHGKAEDPWVLLEVAAPVLEARFLLLDLLLVAASYYCYCWHCLSACCCYC